jgi:hypothetical protein
LAEVVVITVVVIVISAQLALCTGEVVAEGLIMQAVAQVDTAVVVVELVELAD